MNYEQVHKEAVEAGFAALKAATPTPMVVSQHAHPFDDSSEVVQSWYVSEGVCGFAWVQVKGNTAFARWVRKHHWGDDLDRWVAEAEGGRWSKGYPSGYHFWVWAGGQSYERKLAFARAYAEVLQSYGVEAYASGRLD